MTAMRSSPKVAVAKSVGSQLFMLSLNKLISAALAGHMPIRMMRSSLSKGVMGTPLTT
jgi:hypothetical protein